MERMLEYPVPQTATIPLKSLLAKRALPVALLGFQVHRAQLTTTAVTPNGTVRFEIWISFSNFISERKVPFSGSQPKSWRYIH